MLLINAVSWWYTRGWLQRIQLIQTRLVKVVDFFSVDLLLKTLFSPFRQIGTEAPGRGLEAAFRAFLDGLISRSIGFVVRCLTIIAGIVALFISLILGVVEVVVWLLLPALPIFGAVLYAVGWVPYVGL